MLDQLTELNIYVTFFFSKKFKANIKTYHNRLSKLFSDDTRSNINKINWADFPGVAIARTLPLSLITKT